MTEIENYIYGFEGNQRQILLHLHRWLSNDLMLSPKLRYGIPFYFRKSWVCYISPTKDGFAEFAFPRGNELSNEQGLLERKGRKQVSSIKIKSIQDIPQSLFEIVQEAILLDESIPYHVGRKKG